MVPSSVASAGEPQRQRERDEVLLGAVVEVALDPAARVVAGGDQPGARGAQLLVAGAQLGVEALVAQREPGRRAGRAHELGLLEQRGVVDDRGDRRAVVVDLGDGARRQVGGMAVGVDVLGPVRAASTRAAGRGRRAPRPARRARWSCRRAPSATRVRPRARPTSAAGPPGTRTAPRVISAISAVSNASAAPVRARDLRDHARDAHDRDRRAGPQHRRQRLALHRPGAAPAPDQHHAHAREHRHARHAQQRPSTTLAAAGLSTISRRLSGQPLQSGYGLGGEQQRDRLREREAVAEPHDAPLEPGLDLPGGERDQQVHERGGPQPAEREAERCRASAESDSGSAPMNHRNPTSVIRRPIS